MTLKEFLAAMTLRERDEFAARVGSKSGHLRNISYGYRPCGESLAIEIERESRRKVTCEELRPDVDWAFIRSTARGTPRAAKSCA